MSSALVLAVKPNVEHVTVKPKLDEYADHDAADKVIAEQWAN